MTDRPAAAAIRRSTEEIEVARLLAGNGHPAQAVSRAYFAAFYAAEAALLELGESRSKHSGVVAAFGKLVVKEGGMDAASGAVLVDLFARRNDADYLFANPPSIEDAVGAVDDAERFLVAVRDWLSSRG